MLIGGRNPYCEVGHGHQGCSDWGFARALPKRQFRTMIGQMPEHIVAGSGPTAVGAATGGALCQKLVKLLLVNECPQWNVVIAGRKT